MARRGAKRKSKPGTRRSSSDGGGGGGGDRVTRTPPSRSPPSTPPVPGWTAAASAALCAAVAAVLWGRSSSLLTFDSDALDRVLGLKKGGDDGDGDAFASVRLILHRNGEPSPCGGGGGAPPDRLKLVDALRRAAGELVGPSPSPSSPSDPSMYTMYHVDHLLTRAVADSILSPAECGCPDVDHATGDGGGGGGGGVASFLDYCDMGTERTPVLSDHGSHIPVIRESSSSSLSSLPCHFHTREGLRITSLRQLSDLIRERATGRPDGTTGTSDADGDGHAVTVPELPLHAVPAGRIFMFAPSRIGEVFDLDHIVSGGGGTSSSSSGKRPVRLEVLSLEPRVFDLHHFFDESEADRLMEDTLALTDESVKLKRSVTTGDKVHSRRTSENAIVHQTETASALKRRGFDVLGFAEYTESLADGLQIVRYNKTAAYVPHYDYHFVGTKHRNHDYDSSGVGTNRFATILMYLSDPGDGNGGETVFTKVYPPDKPEGERVSLKDSLRSLRDGASSGDGRGKDAASAASIFAEGSWEEQMVAECRTRLAVRPKKARAMLFYSQHPMGERDDMSYHGGCPVLGDEDKWVANLWIWNGPRRGYPDAPKAKDAGSR